MMLQKQPRALIDLALREEPIKFEYRNINNLKWDEILRHNCRTWQAPMTVHLPIHPCHSTVWVMVDSALDISCLPVFPELSEEDKEKRKNRDKNEVMLLQFAFDNPPFVPDARFSEIRLYEGRYPIAVASYYAWDIHYSMEYFCQPLDAGQNILWISVSVSNEDDKPRPVSVRTKVSFLPEGDAFDMHYVPFYRDAGKYLPCFRTSMENERIRLDGRQVGKIVPGGFDFKWEAERDFENKEYNRRFDYETPYFVPPPMRYRNVRHAIHFSTGVNAGESASFSMALLTDWPNISSLHLESLADAEPEEGRKVCLEHFKTAEEKDKASIQFPVQRWDDILFRMETSVRQMMLRPADKDYLIPLQGGTSARHFVWVWEAQSMLYPMLKLGHFGVVRDALRFIFSLQDSGYTPAGRLTTVKGAVGTTGPRWLNTTGSALGLASDYCMYSHDTEFIEEYLPAMFKAAGWIIGEITATRKLNEDGTRPPYYGLMPFGNATDGDIGYIVTATDSYTFMGLSRFSELLACLGHERADEIKRETEIYRNDIKKAVEYMTRPDGFIERKILTGDEKTYITRKFEYVSGAQKFFYTGVLDLDYEGFGGLKTYWEKNIADGPFMGRMDREVFYMGNSEYYWHDIYLKTGEWKKAFLAVQSYMKYGMTEETFLLQERFSKRNPAYTPWQPNGSGCGRMVDMIIKSFYFEEGRRAVLFPGIPFSWLKDSGRTVLNGLYVPGGRVSLEAKMGNDNECLLVLTGETTQAMPLRIEIPDFFTVVSAGMGVDGKKNVFSLLPGSLRAEFIVADAHK